MTKIKIAIADDHKLFREGLASLLEKNLDFEVVKEFSNGKNLLDYIKENPEKIDVLLLDINMPEVNGFEVLKEIQNKQMPKALVISMHEEDAYIKSCAKLGAYGYLLKNTDEEELQLAINEIYLGKKYYNQMISNKLVNSMLEEGKKKSLTSREIDVLKLIASGFGNKEIADELNISVRTAETHRANMIKKMKVKNTIELVREAYKHNLINYV